MLTLIDEWRNERPDTEFVVFARSPEGLLQPELAQRGIVCITLPFNSIVAHRRVTEPADVFRTSREDFAAVRAIARFLEEWSPDLVMTNTIVAPWAAVAAALVGVPHVWFPREYGDDHEFQLPRNDVFSDIGLLSDLVVANSRALHDFLAQWIPVEKLTVLYPPVNLEAIRALADEEKLVAPPEFSASPDLRAVCVARIARSKGQHRLLAALAVMRGRGVNAEAVLVGPGTDRDLDELHAEVARLGLQDVVHLTGELVNPFPYVKVADVGIVVSDSEGFGRSTLEYMALGKPVVAHRAGATVELVEDGVSGILVEPDNVNSLVDALLLYATEPGLREKHGREAAARANGLVARHSFDQFLARLDMTIASERAGMGRLPAIMASWFALPEVSYNYLTAAGATLDPRTELPWRVGTRIAGALRLVLPRRLRAGGGR